MGHLRERYNAKARQSSARPRKRAKHSHSSNDAVEGTVDPNAEIVSLKTDEERAFQRREKAKQELLQQAESKFTSKKKKRLEKYIDKKLKKEERVQIFEKLQQSQADYPASLHLQSSAILGTGKKFTNQQRLDIKEDAEVRRAIEGKTSGKAKRRRRPNLPMMITDDSDSDRSVMDGLSQSTNPTQMEVIQVITQPSLPSSSKQSAPNSEVIPVMKVEVGSALKRTADGELPITRVLKKTAKKKLHLATSVVEPSDDSSFDSSDSAYDESDAEEDKEVAGRALGNDSLQSSGSDSDERSDSAHGNKNRKRIGFKDWAVKQLSLAKDYVAPPESPQLFSAQENSITRPVELPAVKTNSMPRLVGNDKPIMEKIGPLGEELLLPDNPLSEQIRKADSVTSTQILNSQVVHVLRPPEIQEARLALPIVSEEQSIIEAIRLNPVVLICGETGSGKTTQVPQFLYEAGFGRTGGDNPGMIGVTQPRRVAAVAMASRVAQELSLTTSEVSYQIRYDATVSPTTKIKFMTDGVLLRELANDFLLTNYSVIIVDEAHERSINTDILIGVLSRVQKLRLDMWKDKEKNMKPLRLVIMSATLRVEDFMSNKNLFASFPPLINISARQYPVTVHFNRRTATDYGTEAVKKAVKIHTRLPPGGILIFLTGQSEITGVCKKLGAMFGPKAIVAKLSRQRASAHLTVPSAGLSKQMDINSVLPATQADFEPEEMDLGDFQEEDLALDVDGSDGVIDDEALDSDEESQDEIINSIGEESNVPMHILPLYSLLPSERQMQVFQSPPLGARLVVVATNVAETSLTIPGIRYVVDCGRAKERHYEASTSIQSFKVSWISKASAAQRTGRAGRTGPGHCYRLYSSAVFEHQFRKFSEPEILRMPIEGVLLQMKSMHIDTVLNFPFPTPPDKLTLKKAETLLTRLGALTPPTGSTNGGLILALEGGGHITQLGNIMALFPLSPRFSKMLVSGGKHGCLPYVIATVSALSVGDPFIHEDQLEMEEETIEKASHEDLSHIRSQDVKIREERKALRRSFLKSRQLHARLGKAQSDVFSYLSVVGAYEYAGGGHQFCAQQFVRPKAMEEIHKLRHQISGIVATALPASDTGFAPKLRPPNELQLKVLRQLLCAAFIDQVAVRKDLVTSTSTSGVKFATTRDIPYRAVGVDEDVFLHPSSVLFDQTPPDFVVYQDLVRTTRLWMKVITVINPAWLGHLGKGVLCTFSKPQKNSHGDLMVIPRFGPAGWELPPMKADCLAV